MALPINNGYTATGRSIVARRIDLLMAKYYVIRVNIPYLEFASQFVCRER